MRVSSAQPPDAYAGMRSARRPPSRRQTGAPSDLPRRSQSARSTPAIAEIERPRRPSWGSTWPRSTA